MADGSVDGTELADGVLDSVDPAGDRPTLRERRIEAWIAAGVAMAASVAVIVARAASEDLLVDLVVVGLGFFVVIVCGVISLVKVFRFPVPGLVGLAAVVGWFVVVATGVPHDPPLDPLRDRDVAVYRAEGDDALAAWPPGKAEAVAAGPRELPTDGSPFVITDGSASAVAWLEGGGFGPGRGAGLVYDPHGALAGGHELPNPDSTYVVARSSCDHLRGPWYWCRLA